MNKLEEYIRSHSAEFDTAVPSEGAEDRFLEKWEAGERRTRGTVRVLRAVLPVAAAAALALLLLLPKADRSRDWLRGAEDTPEGIYLCYMTQVSEAWKEVGPDRILSEQLRSLTEETVPLADLLPAELDDESQTAILRRHYNTLLDGVHALINNYR